MSHEEFTVFGGRSPSTVLLSGWATDGRVFDGFFSGEAVARSCGPLRPEGFHERLAAFLDGSAAGPVTVVGWSLGGFLAAAFAVRYPSRLRRLVLVGVRRRYPAADIEAVRAALLRDRRACLSDFHAKCFFPSRMREYRSFRAGLQEEYLRGMDEAALLEGLSFLSANDFPPSGLRDVPVTIVHGGRDVIAPAREAEAVARETGGAAFLLLPDAPHAAFLDEGFRAAVSGTDG